MEQTWRWYGPADPVTLIDARQAGATGIVTALHQIESGKPWSQEAIRERQEMVAAAGMRWSVVESLNVSEVIKTRGAGWQADIDSYCATLRNLAACGIKTVCYNFMPVLDWVRTDYKWKLADGSLCVRFDEPSMAAFDLYILQRKGADADWTEAEQSAAHKLYSAMSVVERDTLANTVLAGLPGTGDIYSLEYMRRAIDSYKDIGVEGARANLGEFLRAVCPTADEVGVRLCIHPDDPPRSYMGLPRIMSTFADYEFLLQQTPLESNGVTFCSGALGVRADNDIVPMARALAHRIYFSHLRSTKREAVKNTFYEAPHLAGDVDMVGLIKVLMLEERRRKLAGNTVPIPFRADHGNLMLTDIERPCVPGYPAIGRLKGLAELRGVMTALDSLMPA